ncbi:hypothetical protein [Hyalangium versicolor]|uniref:hypothetical protein n=1 Tax=Hyalangium versicolor TaxID=2861190 RepID=UPI001CCDC312|nr:hypothetical protein [Hyalangium versicolor]
MMSLLCAVVGASMLTACGAEPSDGGQEPEMPSQPDMQPQGQADIEPTQELAQTAGLTTVWYCYRVRDNSYQGTVAIWWGHKPSDAAWACNNWKSACGNSPGGCFATYAGYY